MAEVPTEQVRLRSVLALAVETPRELIALFEESALLESPPARGASPSARRRSRPATRCPPIARMRSEMPTRSEIALAQSPRRVRPRVPYPQPPRFVRLSIATRVALRRSRCLATHDRPA